MLDPDPLVCSSVLVGIEVVEELLNIELLLGGVIVVELPDDVAVLVGRDVVVDDISVEGS